MRTGEPFFTVHKAPMRAITDGIEGTEAAFAAALYVALRWHANDERAPDGPVTATVAQLARRAGVSYKTAAKALGVLRAIGVLGIEGRSVPGTKARAPSVYTFPVLGGTSGAMCGTLGTDTPPSRAEIRKKERKESKEGGGAGAPTLPDSIAPDAAARIAAECAITAGGVAAGYRRFKGKKEYWRDPVADVEGALATFLLDTKEGKAICAKHRASTPAAAASASLPEPDGWEEKAAQDLERYGYAKGTWARLFAPHQEQLTRLCSGANA